MILSKTVTEKTSQKVKFKFGDLSKSLEYVKTTNLVPLTPRQKNIGNIVFDQIYYPVQRVVGK